MQITVFNTPVVTTALRWISLFLLKVLGWKRTGALPHDKKYVMIAAPHTSNWDFFYGLIMNLSFKNSLYWMGKKEIFRFPFGGVMRWFGGIPVDRSRSNNLVTAVIERFGSSESLVVTIPPEGTRSMVDSWKTGFYHIARGAEVPVLLAFVDYKKKVTGYGPMFRLTDNMENDMVAIKTFYAGIRGRHETFCVQVLEAAGVPE